MKYSDLHISLSRYEGDHILDHCGIKWYYVSNKQDEVKAEISMAGLGQREIDGKIKHYDNGYSDIIIPYQYDILAYVLFTLNKSA